MKPMNNSNNWLGFSLSPQMSMEVAAADPHHQGRHSQAQPAPPASVSPAATGSFFLSPHSGICYGVEGATAAAAAAAFCPQLAVMPLKSDGSLCIMEALGRSEGMMPSPSPKLEDFLGGGPNMGTHHQYGNSDREAMALSLASMYYHQHSDADDVVVDRTHPLDLLQQPFRHQIPAAEHHQQQHAYFQPLQEEGMCSGLTGHDLYQSDPLEEEASMAEDGIPCLKNWVARHYSSGSDGGLQGNEAGGVGPINNGAMGYGDLQSLSLSMSPGSQSSCVTAPQQVSPAAATECMAQLDNMKKRAKLGGGGQKQPVHRKSIDTFGQRTSQYRGVTRHRWTGRYEAHLWDNSCKKEGQTRKGRQVYLGGYDTEEKAARAYDLAALKYWGPSTHINFPLESYPEELEGMKNMSRQEYVAHLRRKSSGFSRGASMYRGVTRHHQHGRWQARIGRVAGNKDLYLGTFSTQEEAAEAYDVAAIKFRGANAVTNFDITRYDVEKIMASNTLLSGELARRKAIMEAGDKAPAMQIITGSREADLSAEQNGSSDWKMVLYPSSEEQSPAASEPHTRKTTAAPSIGNYRAPATSFSPPLHGLLGIEAVQGMEDGGGMMGSSGTQLKSSSPFVTSLSCSSGEQSPDRTGVSMLFARSPAAAAKFVTAAPLSSWIPTTQIRPAIPMAQMPLFAPWSETI